MERFLLSIKNNKLVRILYYPIANCTTIFRNWTYTHSADSRRLLTLKNTHIGERCFIIGNGPSLTPEDLDKLKDEVSFGSNKIYFMFNKTQWRPNYYVAMDTTFISANISAIKKLNALEVFVGLNAKKYYILQRNKPTFIYLKKTYRLNNNEYCQIAVSEDISNHFTFTCTVTCTCLEMAMYMGFKEIYLLGVDHHYAKTIDENGVIHTDPTVKNYFEGMEGDQSIAIHPKEQATKGYQAIRDYADAHGIKIYNATRGGKLEVFERVEFDSLFEEAAFINSEDTDA